LVIHQRDDGWLRRNPTSEQASRIPAIAIVIGLMGLTMTGILIAVTVHAATLALVAHDAAQRIR
jgi:hypothetical protein